MIFRWQLPKLFPDPMAAVLLGARMELFSEQDGQESEESHTCLGAAAQSYREEFRTAGFRLAQRPTSFEKLSPGEGGHFRESSSLSTIFSRPAAPAQCSSAVLNIRRQHARPEKGSQALGYERRADNATGAAYGSIRVASRSTTAGALMHATYNLTVFLFATF